MHFWQLSIFKRKNPNFCVLGTPAGEGGITILTFDKWYFVQAVEQTNQWWFFFFFFFFFSCRKCDPNGVFMVMVFSWKGREKENQTCENVERKEAVPQPLFKYSSAPVSVLSVVFSCPCRFSTWLPLFVSFSLWHRPIYAEGRVTCNWLHFSFCPLSLMSCAIDVNAFPFPVSDPVLEQSNPPLKK